MFRFVFGGMESIYKKIPPAIGSAIYLSLPNWKSTFEMIPKPHIYVFTVIHNTFLTIFSTIMFCKLSQVIFLGGNGIAFEHRHYFQHPNIRQMIWWVYMSKYYEYVDTALLYANRKTPIFLQVFHHTGAVLLWYLAYDYQCDFIVYVSWFNCGVHSIMYSYYLASLYIQVSAVIKRAITILQIGQLASGLIILPVAYRETETWENQQVMHIFFLYEMILLALFCNFMHKTYR